MNVALNKCLVFCVLLIHTRGVTVQQCLITVISIITVLLKCAGDVQKVLTHKSRHQVLYLKINKQQIN